jgi:hypothetical protein
VEVIMDILSLLVWLSGAGISAVSAFVLERVSGFATLSPNGKQTVATIVAVLIAACAMWAHDYLSANPDVMDAYRPYLQIAITGASILVQQIAHGVQRSVNGGSNG